MGKNLCTTKGANTIIDNVENYWRDRGFAVEVEAKNLDEGFDPDTRCVRVDVRSKMVNGLPHDFAERDNIRWPASQRPRVARLHPLNK